MNDESELTQKWEPVLVYTDDACKPLHFYEYIVCAEILEQYEQKYMKNLELCKVIIPHIRRQKGNINCEEKNIDGKRYLIVYDYINHNSGWMGLEVGTYNIAFSIDDNQLNIILL